MGTFSVRFYFMVTLTFIFQLGVKASLFGQLDSTNLPLFVIHTNGMPIPDEPKITADLQIISQDSSYNHPGDSANVYHGPIGIEIRGKYSASLPQKPYGLETRDSLGQNLNVPLLHMPPENDWILLANYNDKTFMRNALAFEIFREMGHYAPRTQHCEVIVNGIYQGIYVFTEKIKRDRGRIDIATLNPDEVSGDDLTGGYVIKIDYYTEDNSWVSDYPVKGQDVHLVYHYPDELTIAGAQANYLRNFIHEFESTLYGPNTPARQQKLWKYADIHSFVDYFILGEVSRNVDAYKKSAYFFKDRDSKGGRLHAGPVWDFDWAWKNINECYFGVTDGSGWAYQVHQCNPWPVPPGWMVNLLQDPYFEQQVSERYLDLRASILSEASLFHYVDSVATVLDEAQKRHYSRWQILGLNVGTPEVDKQPVTYAGEIAKFKEWISKRLSWLDANIPGLVVTGIHDLETSQGIFIYPQPVSSLLKIRSEQKITSMEIYSSNGNKLYHYDQLESSEIAIDISFLKSGFYIIQAELSDGVQWRGKFIKSNGV